MLSCLIPLALLTFTAISLSLIFQKDFAELLAPVVFSVILLLYGFYIFDLLPMGHMVVTILCLLVTSASLFLRRAGRDSLKQVIAAPAFTAYVAGLLVLFLFSCNKFVSLWDCLRLWGAYPKALHATGSIQLGENALLFPIMQSYPPGMPLLGYYFTRFSPVFSESTLFFTYSFFGFSLMLPFLREVGSKKSAAVTLLAILFVPYFITGMNTDEGYYYSSLYIDIPLGICCGYFFSRVFHPKHSFDSFCAMLSCGCLMLLKDSGSFLALCGVVGGLLCHFLGKHKGNKTYFLWLLLPSVMIAFAYGSWKYMTGMFTVENHIRLTPYIPSFTTLARIFFHLLRTPVSGIFTVTGAVHVSLPAALLMIFCAKLILAHRNPQTLLKEEIGEVAVQFVCFVCFFAGYCFSFLSEIEKQIYPSYVRYFCTLVACMLYVLLYDCRFRHRPFLQELSREISAGISPEGHLAGLVRSARRLLLGGMILAMVFSAVLILFDFPSKQSDFYVQAEDSAAVLTDVIETPADVYLCIPSTEDNFSRLHHRIYFNLLDDGIRIKNFYTEVDITDPSFGFTDETFLDHLIEKDYDYVMLTGVEDVLLDHFPELFSDASLEDTNLIYQVDAAARQLIRIR